MMPQRFWLVAFLSFVGMVSLHAEDVTITSIVDPAAASVLHSRAIHIYLRANKPDVVVSNVALSLNEELSAVRPDLKKEAMSFENLTNSREMDEIHLDVTKKTELLFHYRSRSFWSPLSDWNLITFEPGMQKLTLRYELNPPVTGPSVGLSEPVEVMITAPALSVTVGGAAGALALALLRFIYRLRKADGPIHWRAEFLETVIAVFAGGLIAGILTFLGALLKDANLGVEIAATSWKGGVIIGLFSYKLGDILAQKLWDQPEAPRP
jgi:hypothetical protein